MSKLAVQNSWISWMVPFVVGQRNLLSYIVHHFEIIDTLCRDSQHGKQSHEANDKFLHSGHCTLKKNG